MTRLDLERGLLQSQICMVTSDLNTVETKLHETTEELNIAISQIGHLTENNASLNVRIEDLSQQILAHNEETTKMEEKHQKELQAKVRLAELYKAISDEVIAEQRATLKKTEDKFNTVLLENEF
jgi:regulator of replication initiation timing